ncbi:MAG: DUF4416 family protein [Chlamydiota bacterium]|nr:DUF4416 family protein [Chlamydiota bacterium]
MGVPLYAHPVILVAGLLASSEEQMSNLVLFLNGYWDGIAEKSDCFSFSFSKYYQDELGDDPVRQYIAWNHYCDPDRIRHIKHETNTLEKLFSKKDQRLCNIDPGYLSLHQMVLASTKPATYRVYLGEGIYGQSTLYYKGRSFRPWPWTYKDYCQQVTIDFFNRVRKFYKRQYNFTNEDSSWQS